MSQLDDLLRDLVVANRILAHEEVVDAYGHISVRHPDNPKRFFMSRSLAPELVERHDLIEFDEMGEPVNDKRPPYLERFIHAAIFEARPDVVTVVHAHAEDTLPFGLVATPLVPMIHSASFVGGEVPVWNIRDKFGDTNLLVTNMAQGRDLAARHHLEDRVPGRREAMPAHQRRATAARSSSDSGQKLWWRRRQNTLHRSKRKAPINLAEF